ncbi:T9SS type A sorting domain-containing protein [Spirosoma sp. HMF4905]|uniref:T9SS type A sorting domain-containing protein n=1 Tax=Spirosoma arboris TaxID=2682092 RepID=A0A7K1SHJ0_9BACT|nr:T9SS type A sorting domain-containing protein [Spirosoma arboris]MVM33262.1 T9SS type A sorting domain-containing protein [Spirosoma arboris]
MNIRGVVLLWLLANTLSVAQKQANHWYFGQNAGLRFDVNCQPIALQDGQMSSDYGSAVMSDAQTGQLLFYTDSYRIWNRQHQLMPHGQLTDYAGRGALSQGSLFVPVPGQPSQYYFFHLVETNRTNTGPADFARLTYSIIDMGLDEGRGDVVTAKKDSTLAQGLAGRLTAIPHQNGYDYWVLTHQYNTDAFLIYPVTAQGIGPADTLRIGSVYQGQAVYGMLKASPDGHKVASSSMTTQPHAFDLFDFNPATGRLTNYVNLGDLRLQYGVSFSPDNSKLYLTTQQVLRPSQPNQGVEYIRQYDLRSADPKTIIGSGRSIIDQNPLTNFPTTNLSQRQGFYAASLQLGPDGRLYCVADYSNPVASDPCSNCSQHILVINRPNEPGFACNVQLQTAELGVGRVGDANDLPNFMQHYFNGLLPLDCAFDQDDGCTGQNIKLFPNPVQDQAELLITDLCYKPYQLRILNVVGQVLSAYWVTTARSQVFNFGHLAAGHYVAELRFANRTLIKRFVKL